MFLKSNLNFIYDHKIVCIFPGDNKITPEIKKQLSEDKAIQEHLSIGNLIFINDAEFVEIKKEKKELAFGSCMPEYKAKDTF